MAVSVRDKLKAKKQAYVQEQIAAAAAKLFAERGYRAVTIDDIASSLGYTKSVVFYYFKNKGQLLWAIFDQIQEAYASDIKAIMAMKLPTEFLFREMIKRHAINNMERSDWTAIYSRDDSELPDSKRQIIKNKKKEYDNLFRKVYEDGVAEGVFRRMPTYVVVGGILGMCNWSHQWYKKSGRFSAAEIADYYVAILSDGLNTQPRSASRAGDSEPPARKAV